MRWTDKFLLEFTSMLPNNETVLAIMNIIKQDDSTTQQSGTMINTLNSYKNIL